MRVTVIMSTVVLGAGLIAGCGSGGGSDSTSTYCKQLKAAKADFAALESQDPDFSKLGDAIATFHKIADSAPSAVADDWKTLDTAFATLKKAFDDAGISMEDFGAISQGQMPEGMSQADLAALGPKLEATFTKLDEARVTKAGKAIEKHAKSACHIDLGTS